MKRTLLVDLGERELKKRQELRARMKALQYLTKHPDTSGDLSQAQEDELKDIQKRLGSDVVADEFYRMVASTYTQNPWKDLEAGNEYVHEYGFLGSQRILNQPVSGLTAKEREIIGICGLLQLDGHTDPSRRGFVQKISIAQGEYQENRALFDAAFEKLTGRYEVSLQSQVSAGLIDGSVYGCIMPGGNPQDRKSAGDELLDPTPKDIVSVLSGRNIAAVVRKMAADSVSANDPWLASRIENGYEMQSGVIGGAPPSSLDIELPDLEEATDVEIIRENLDAAQAIYFAYQLEEARMPQVVEKIVDLFRAGLLPLSYGKAGDYLYGYYKKAAERITEGERRDLYMRAFGAPGGDPEINQPNREFNELWLRFISAVSAFGRQLNVDRMFRSHVPLAVSQEQVRKAARDLAASLSRSCYGIAYQFSKELKTLIIEHRDLLGDQEVRGAFGARDMWQVIDQVNANYLGGPRNTHRYRTQARSGAVIIAWLSQNHQRLTSRYGDVIAVNALTNPQLRGSDRPMVDPTDWDLLQACEQWLAVGGVQDQRVEEYAQPIESPTITSKPMDMPQFARDAMASAGISLPSL